MPDFDGYIDSLQAGKSGIYPYRVAQDVAARFNVPLSVAIAAVLEHIKRELAKAIR